MLKGQKYRLLIIALSTAVCFSVWNVLANVKRMKDNFSIAVGQWDSVEFPSSSFASFLAFDRIYMPIVANESTGTCV
jgi:hypothetical protein